LARHWPRGARVLLRRQKARLLPAAPAGGRPWAARKRLRRSDLGRRGAPGGHTAVLVEAIQPIEHQERDQGHDQPRPDGGAPVGRERLDERFGGFCCHGLNLPPAFSGGNSRAAPRACTADSLTVSARSGQ